MSSILRRLLSLGFACVVVTVAWAAPQLYTCGMHPQIISDQPGNCPVCGMKLQPILASVIAATPAANAPRKVLYYKSTMIPGEIKPGPGKDSMGMDMVPVYAGQDLSEQNNIHLDPATVQRMNLRTALVTTGPVERDIRTVGTVAYDERGLNDVTTRYDGWIQKLYVNATWTVVKRGEPLFEIYSPDVYNAELNFVVALQSEGGPEGPLSRSALARLQLLDVSPDVIATLRQTGHAERTLLYRAPADGVVTTKNVIAGQMIKAGQIVYQLADLSKVWVLAQVYEKDAAYIHTGEPVTVETSYGLRRTYHGTVQLLVPQVQDATRTLTARIVLANPDGSLRPGMYTDVRFRAEISPHAVLVPDMAVLRSGERDTVFIALPDGTFEPRRVTLGAYSRGDCYQVLSGLKAGERIVTSGQFMLDSESQLREAIQKMLKSPATPAAPQPAPAAAPAAARKVLYYKSTMKSGETSPTPAKDSMGMQMVPVYATPATAPVR